MSADGVLENAPSAGDQRGLFSPKTTRLSLSHPVSSPRRSSWDVSWLPIAAWRSLRLVVSQFRRPRPPLPRNLLGDRAVEWSFIAANLPMGPGNALDFGCGSGTLGLVAAQAGFDVLAMDLGHVEWRYEHRRLRFVQADLLKVQLAPEEYDLVVNCSAVEHVGLVGRYGVTEALPNGDLEAMRRLFECLVPGGMMLLTVPVGKDAVFEPMTRVYGQERLPKLLVGFEVEREEFWVKDELNRWVKASKEEATGVDASAGAPEPASNLYSLGCFVLRKPTALGDQGQAR